MEKGNREKAEEKRNCEGGSMNLRGERKGRKGRTRRRDKGRICDVDN